MPTSSSEMQTVRVGLTDRIWVPETEGPGFTFRLVYTADGTEVVPGRTYSYEQVCRVQAAMNDLARALGTD